MNDTFSIRKWHLLSCLTLFSSYQLLAQASLNGVYGSDSTNTLKASDYVNDLLIDADGNLMIVGQQERTLQAQNGQVYEYGTLTTVNPQGAIILNTRIVFKEIFSISPTSDGEFVVCGTGSGFQCTSGLCKADMLVAKINAQGVPYWGRSFGNPIYNGSDGARRIKAIQNGNILLIGNLYESSQNSNIFAAKLNSNGDTLWTRAIGTSSSQFGHDISEDAQGNLYVAGGGVGGMMVAKLTASGNFVWGRSLTVYGEAIRLFPLADGSVTVVGDFLENNMYRISVTNMSSAGAVNYTHKFYLDSATHNQFVHDAVMDGSGNLYISGYHYNSTNYTGFHPLLLKVASDGSLVWARTYPDWIAEGKTIYLHPDGSLVWGLDRTGPGGYTYQPDMVILNIAASDGYADCLDAIALIDTTHAFPGTTKALYSYHSYETQPTMPTNQSLYIWKKPICSQTTLESPDASESGLSMQATAGQLLISGVKTDCVWEVYDMGGRKIRSGNLETGNTSISTQDLKAGAYILRVFDAMSVQSWKWVKTD